MKITYGRCFNENVLMKGKAAALSHDSLLKSPTVCSSSYLVGEG